MKREKLSTEEKKIKITKSLNFLKGEYTKLFGWDYPGFKDLWHKVTKPYMQEKLINHYDLSVPGLTDAMALKRGLIPFPDYRKLLKGSMFTRQMIRKYFNISASALNLDDYYHDSLAMFVPDKDNPAHQAQEEINNCGAVGHR
jgi:hypothetical protein